MPGVRMAIAERGAQRVPAYRAEDGGSILESVRKVRELLSRSEKKRVLLLIPMITIMAVMQVVGVASVAPFLALGADPTAIEQNRYLASAYDMLGFHRYQSSLIFAGVG